MTDTVHVRGILHRRLEDFPAAVEDLVQAAELSEDEETLRRQAEAGDEGGGGLQKDVEFQLVLTYNDFAVQCFSRGLYAEATLLLNKAIRREKGQAGLYLNRGGEATNASPQITNLTLTCNVAAATR